MWSVEFTDRNLVGDEMSTRIARKPSMEMKCRRFDPERRHPQLAEIQIDRVVGCRANGGGNSGKHGQHRTMDVPAADQPDARMPPDDLGERIGVEKILRVHVPDAALEGRMVEKQQRRPVGGSERCVEPLQRRRFKRAMRLPGHAGIEQQQIETADLDL